MRLLVLGGSLVQCSLMAVAVAQTGTLKMTFLYDGDAPAARAINADRDAAFCGQFKMTDESLVVNPENRGIKHVVAYVFTGRGGSKLASVPPNPGKTVTLDNRGCIFQPHIVVARTGDTLMVKNSDTIPHNANMNFFKNKPQNPTIPPNDHVSVKLESDEPAPMPIDCNIHPWMKSFIVVTDHPYVGVSDENGVLEIADLPIGDLNFRVYLEAVQGSVDGVTVGGKLANWTNNRFDVKIGPGLTDLGEVKIPAKNFK